MQMLPASLAHAEPAHSLFGRGEEPVQGPTVSTRTGDGGTDEGRGGCWVFLDVGFQVLEQERVVEGLVGQGGEWDLVGL